LTDRKHEREEWVNEETEEEVEKVEEGRSIHGTKKEGGV